MKKIIQILFSAILLNAVAIVTADPFNKNLTAEERETLEKGEVLIKKINSLKELCIQEREETTKILETVKALKPNYTAEIIQVRPYEGNEDLIKKINDSLTDVSDYAGIPYYSVRHKKYFDLYDAAVITDSKTEGNKTVINAAFLMNPFGVFKAEIDIEDHPNYFFYMMKNLDKMKFDKKITAVDDENMQSVITVFRDGDNWVLYAVGGVKTLKLFFLEERIEVSFINRIKSFCNFIFKKI